MQSTFLLMVASAVFGSGLAIAQSAIVSAPETKVPGYLAKFDEQFKAADRDGDGALSRAEAGDANLSRVVDNFERLDANSDGKVTRNEMRALIRSKLSS